MVLEKDPIIFLQWLPGALLFFLIAAGLLALVALVFSFVVLAFRLGPLPAGDRLFKAVVAAFDDLIHTSPRRVMALAWLAMQESLRRKILIALAVFFLLMLFAGWFLDSTTNDPATLYLSFVLTSSSYLSLLIALLLSVFSLPTDIKNRTITTVVTKPVRHGEIVIGRILGFAAVGTFMLVAMAVVSYVFVSRGLNHTHEVDAESLTLVAETSDNPLRTGRTKALPGRHTHEVTINQKTGEGATDYQNGHYHDLKVDKRGEKEVVSVSPPRGMLVARVPKYGVLRYRDRTGQTVAKGISVGQEWTYRSFIEGNTMATAVWTFDGITEEQFPKGLPVEMTLRVFRTYKGEIERGIASSLVVKNPKTGRSSALHIFRAKDFKLDQFMVPVEWEDANGKPINLFKDLVEDGQVVIEVQCLEPAQYLGVAKADLYLKARDASFTMNFIKGYAGIWMQMILVTAFGVMFSTFLSGPVALMATVSAIVLGFFGSFVMDLAYENVKGGGPVESLIRIVKQSNMTTEMDEGMTRTVVKSVDAVLLKVMEAFTRLLPDFSTFDNANFLAHGYNVPDGQVLSQILATLGYLLAVFIVGYFFLRAREVSQ
jgi:ABC-type transport system involved in multi-copper enzyme maturation permease subunit